MLRRLRFLFLLLALGLTVAALIRSFVASESLSLRKATAVVQLSTDEGAFVLGMRRIHFESEHHRDEWKQVVRSMGRDPDQDWQMRWLVDMPVGRPMRTTLGFALQHFERPARYYDALGQRSEIPGVSHHITLVEVPGWFVLLLLGAPPIYRLMQRDRQRRQRAAMGVCVSCGHDAGPGYITCPRCGKMFKDDSELNTGGMEPRPAPVESPPPPLTPRLRRGAFRYSSH